MRKFVFAAIFCFCFIFSFSVTPAEAGAQSNDVLDSGFRRNDGLGHAGLFANPNEVFRPLLADPRELQMSLRLTTPVGHKNLGDIAVGDYFGLYRWCFPGRTPTSNGA